MNLQDLINSVKNFVGGAGNEIQQHVIQPSENFVQQRVVQPIQQEFQQAPSQFHALEQSVGNFANQQIIHPLQQVPQMVAPHIQALENNIKNFAIGQNNQVQDFASKIGNMGGIADALVYGAKNPGATLQEVPNSFGTLAENIGNFINQATTKFVKDTGGVIGEGALLGMNRIQDALTMPGEKKMTPDFNEQNYPNLFKLNPADIGRETIGAAFEQTMNRVFPGLSKRNIFARLGGGFVQGMGYAIANGIAQNKSVDEVKNDLVSQGLTVSALEAVSPYVASIFQNGSTKQLFMDQLHSDVGSVKNVGSTIADTSMSPVLQGSVKNPLAQDVAGELNPSNFKSAELPTPPQTPPTGANLSSEGIPPIEPLKNTADYIAEMNNAQNQARNVEKGSILDRAKGVIADVKRKLVDSTAPIEDALFGAQKKGQYEVLPKYNIHDQIDRVSRARELAGQFAKDNGLVDTIKNVPNIDELNQYLIAKHAPEVATTTGRNAQADAQLVKDLAPQYEPYAQKVIQYGQKLLDYATQSGLISQESASALKQKYPNYVPLNRIFNELEHSVVPEGIKTGVANLSSQSVVQKLKGSERAIQNPIESLLTKTLDAFSQGERNIAGKQLASYHSLPGNPFQLEPFRTAENVKSRMDLLTNLKSIFKAQRGDNRTLKFVNKDLRSLNYKIKSTGTEMGHLLDQAQTMASEFEASSKINSILDKAQTREYKINDLLSKYHNGQDAQTKSLLEKFINERKQTISELRTELSGLKDVSKQPGDNTISFLNDGIREVWKTTPEIAQAAKLLDKRQLGFIGKIFAIPVRVARVGITGLNVPFIASNIAKDQVSAAINTTHALETSIAHPTNFLKSAWTAIGHGAEYDNWIRSAGGGTSFDISRNAAEESVAKIRSERNIGSRIGYTVTHPSELFRMAENVVARSEEMTRLQQFIGVRDALVKEGRTMADATQLAARQSREATVNFARSGDWGKALNSAFLYMNAGIQGSRTLVRNIAERPVATGVKIALTVMAPLATVTAWNLSDPQRKAAYDDIQDFEKENNLVIVPPNPTKDPKTGKWNVIKIPFSQEVANLTVPLRKGIEALQGYDAPGFADFAKSIIGSTTSLNVQSPQQLAGQFIPQGVKTPMEMLLNKSTFTGTDIVPQYLNGQVSKNLPPEMQVRPDTSGTAREIGGALGVSPMKVEYGVKSAFGGLGSQFLNAVDQAQASAGIIPQEQIGGQSIPEGLTSRFAQAAGGQKLTNLFNGVQNKSSNTIKTTNSTQTQGAKPDDKRIVENKGTFYTTVGKSVKSFDNVGDAQQALNKDDFANSNKNFQVIDGMVYRKNKTGNVETPMTENDYNNKLYGAKLINQKKNLDIKGWMQTANSQFEVLNNQLNDPNVDELDKTDIQNKIDTLVTDYQKFASYGGFTKGKKAKVTKPKAIALKLTGFKAPKMISMAKAPKVTPLKLPTLKLAKTQSKKIKINLKASKSPTIGKRLA